MSKFLKHFTVVGDDYHAWNINYKKWENEEEEEEDEEEKEEQPPPTPASGEEGRAADPTAAPVTAPRRPRDFRATLRKLFSSHRFQVGGQRPKMPGVGRSRQLRVTRRGWEPTSATPHSLCRCPLSTNHVPGAYPALGTHGRSHVVRD